MSNDFKILFRKKYIKIGSFLTELRKNNNRVAFFLRHSVEYPMSPKVHVRKISMQQFNLVTHCTALHMIHTCACLAHARVAQ